MDDRNFVDLSRPVRSERVRGFQPPWRTVYVYRCADGHESRVYASAFRGSRPEPARGAMECPRCASARDAAFRAWIAGEKERIAAEDAAQPAS